MTVLRKPVPLLLAAALAACRATEPAPPAEAREVVLLLHGMGRTSASMEGLRDHLVENGFDARTWGYSSFRRTSSEVAEDLSATLRTLESDPAVTRVHLVGHSLGGIVIRRALAEHVPTNFGRAVLLAPPNQGSPIARRLAPWLGAWIRPLDELSDAPDSPIHSIPTAPGVSIGVIAAANDGKVPVSSTHLPSQADHLVVPGFHTFLMNQAGVRAEVVHFLREGRFSS